MSRGVVTPVEPSNRPCWVSAAVCLAGPFFQDTITVCARLSALHRMKPAEPSASDCPPSAKREGDDNTPPAVDVPDYRPVERFWPYLDLPEQPTDEELARLDPELAEALFGTPRRPFSVSLEFPRFRRSGFRTGARPGPRLGRAPRDRHAAQGAATVPVSIRRMPHSSETSSRSSAASTEPTS